jgi:hypothetical protein
MTEKFRKVLETNMKLFYSGFIKASGLMKLVAAFGCIFLTSLLASAAPVNDNFLSAQVLSGVNGMFVGTNVGATKEVGEPTHALNRGGRSVWYKFVASESGVLTLTTAASQFNTLLAVYTGSSVNNLEFVGANDDTSEGNGYTLQSRAVVGLRGGRTYYIAVDGFYSDDGAIATGSVTLDYSFTQFPANDNFSNAINLFGERGSTVTSNVGASQQINEPDHAGNVGGKSVWFKWTAPANVNASFTFSVDGVSVFGDSATLFAIYRGGENGLLSLIPFGYGRQFFYSRITFVPTPGTTYYIAIDGADFGQGTNSITTTFSYGITKKR